MDFHWTEDSRNQYEKFSLNVGLVEQKEKTREQLKTICFAEGKEFTETATIVGSEEKNDSEKPRLMAQYVAQIPSFSSF